MSSDKPRNGKSKSSKTTSSTNSRQGSPKQGSTKQGSARQGSKGSKRQSSRKKKRGPGKFITRLILLFGVAVIVFIGVFVALVELTPFDASKLTLTSTPTTIYDKYGHKYATISAPGSNDLNYSHIPKNLQNALVATEDHNFWDSSSIDAKGILRAAFVDLWSGHLSQGGSTIQEQLAKIVYLTDKKTFSRKFNQILLGVQINRYFSKQEILAMYLNRVYLGEGTTGVKEAAMKYFGVDLGKNPGKLTLAQAALLAGLPQAPSAYDPLQHPQAAMKRRNQVLENMAKYGYITEAQAKQTEKQPLGVSVHAMSGDIWSQHPLMAQFLMDYADKNGISSQLLTQGGLKIYTTIDPQVESAIEQVFEHGNHFASSVNGQKVPAAAVFVDPATGGILGAAGARDGAGARGLDRAYENGQPGSSIKPILDYAPAIENGTITPNSMLNNTPHDFGGGYIPQNDEPNQPAKVTARYALAHSENVAAVSLLQKIGIDTGISFAEQDGIQFTASDHKHLGIAIGGMSQGVNPVQMAQAYEAFANQGIQQQAHLISRIVNQQGDEIYAFHPAAKRIMSAQTATTMTSMMQDVVQYGTGTGAAVPGWGVAGKTGTVQYKRGLTGQNSNWLRLAWFDGYTPNMVGSIYMGWNYDESSSAYHMTGSPSYQCSQIFGDIVRIAEQGRTPQQFQGAPLNPNDKAAVTNLQATWNQSAGGVQLTWQSDVAGQAQFVITRQDVTGSAAGTSSGAGGQGSDGTSGQGGTGTGNGTSSGGASGTSNTAGGTGTGSTGDGNGGSAGGTGSNVNNGTGTGGTGAGGNAGSTFGSNSTAAPVQVGSTGNLSFVDTSVNVGSVYTYIVQAVDPTTNQPVGPPATITLAVNYNGSSGGSANGTSSGTTGGTDTSGTGGAGNGTGQSAGNSVDSTGGTGTTGGTGSTNGTGTGGTGTTNGTGTSGGTTNGTSNNASGTSGSTGTSTNGTGGTTNGTGNSTGSGGN